MAPDAQTPPGKYPSAPRLRPHHLLCTQGYGGKGYSEAFVRGMSEVTDRLRRVPDMEVEITFSTDAICASCPFRMGAGRCRDDEKVLRYDAAVIEALSLEEGRFSYQSLIRRLDAHLAAGEGDERLRAICGDCAWYPISACRENILGGKYLL